MLQQQPGKPFQNGTMKDKKNSNPNIHNEAFGSLKKYQLFALKSPLDLIPFTASFEKLIHQPFSFLFSYLVNPERFNAQYNVMYSLFPKDIHCCIMENKTVIYNDEESLSSNKEKKLPFQTLSLFEDILYLFNKNGFTILKTDIKDYDYLCLIVADKEKTTEHYTQFFVENPIYKTVDLSYLMDKDNPGFNKTNFQFLIKTFSDFQVQISEFHHNKLNQLLGEKNRILNENFYLPLKVFIESDITQKLTQDVNDDYIQILTQEVDSL